MEEGLNKERRVDIPKEEGEQTTIFGWAKTKLSSAVSYISYPIVINQILALLATLIPNFLKNYFGNSILLGTLLINEGFFIWDTHKDKKQIHSLEDDITALAHEASKYSFDAAKIIADINKQAPLHWATKFWIQAIALIISIAAPVIGLFYEWQTEGNDKKASFENNLFTSYFVFTIVSFLMNPAAQLLAKNNYDERKALFTKNFNKMRADIIGALGQERDQTAAYLKKLDQDLLPIMEKYLALAQQQKQLLDQKASTAESKQEVDKLAEEKRDAQKLEQKADQAVQTIKAEQNKEQAKLDRIDKAIEDIQGLDLKFVEKLKEFDKFISTEILKPEQTLIQLLQSHPAPTQNRKEYVSLLATFIKSSGSQQEFMNELLQELSAKNEKSASARNVVIKPDAINLFHLYDDSNINDYVTRVIEKDLGGFKNSGIKTPEGKEIKCHYLLAQKQRNYKDNFEYLVAFTGTIDIHEKGLPIDYFLNKDKQPSDSLAKNLAVIYSKWDEKIFSSGKSFDINDLNDYIDRIIPLIETKESKTKTLEDKKNAKKQLKKKLKNSKKLKAIKQFVIQLAQILAQDVADHKTVVGILNELITINYDKELLKQRIDELNNTRSHQIDVFDELMPEMITQDEAHAKIIMPYNDSSIHWLQGEIQIHKKDTQYNIIIFAHNPYGAGSMPKNNYEVITNTIANRIKAFDSNAEIHFSAEKSPYRRRQMEGDDVSCGVILGDDIIKRIRGESLNIDQPYSFGTEILRSKQIETMQSLPEDNPTRRNFISKNVLPTATEYSKTEKESKKEELKGKQTGLKKSDSEQSKDSIQDLNQSQLHGHLFRRRAGSEGEKIQPPKSTQEIYLSRLQEKLNEYKESSATNKDIINLVEDKISNFNELNEELFNILMSILQGQLSNRSKKEV